MTTLAGHVWSTSGAFADGVGTNARFNKPQGVALAGDKLLVADSTNYRIRQIDLSTAEVTTVAGTGAYASTDGGSDIAEFTTPYGIAATPSGMLVIVTDVSHKVRMFLPLALYPFPPSSPPLPSVPPLSATVAHLAGGSGTMVPGAVVHCGTSGGAGYTVGTGTSAKFYNPYDVALSPSGTFALIADYQNNRIRRIEVSTADVTTLAGSTTGTTDGVGSTALFKNPSSVAVADFGRVAYVTDYTSGNLRRIHVATATVTTIAGTGTSSTIKDGIGSVAQFYNPVGVAATADGSVVFVTDYTGHTVRMVVVATRTVTTLAGSLAATAALTGNGVGTNARFYNPWGIDVTPDGATVFVCEYYSSRIRQIDVASRTVTTLAGHVWSTSGAFADGVGTNARFNKPQGVALAGDKLLVADGGNYRIRQIDVNTQTVTTVAGSGCAAETCCLIDGDAESTTFFNLFGIAVTPNGMLSLVTTLVDHSVRIFMPRAVYAFPPYRSGRAGCRSHGPNRRLPLCGTMDPFTPGVRRSTGG